MLRRTAKRKKRFACVRNARESRAEKWEWPGVRALPLSVQKFLAIGGGGPGVFILDPDDSLLLLSARHGLVFVFMYSLAMPMIFILCSILCLHSYVCMYTLQNMGALWTGVVARRAKAS